MSIRKDSSFVNGPELIKDEKESKISEIEQKISEIKEMSLKEYIEHRKEKEFEQKEIEENIEEDSTVDKIKEKINEIINLSKKNKRIKYKSSYNLRVFDIILFYIIFYEVKIQLMI